MKDKAAKVLIINGAYRDDGFTDQVTNASVEYLQARGIEVDVVMLRDYPINFCLNCRQCTQLPGETPGECIQQDGMQSLVSRIEQSQGLILAAPTNLGSVTALFKRFMERLIVYAYWPWSAKYPIYRKDGQPRKKALVISSCAAPGFLGSWLYGSNRQLKMVARIIGADCVGSLFAGKVGIKKDQLSISRFESRIQKLVLKLL